MLNFEYYIPTKIIFGEKTEMQVGEQILKYGGSKVLLHYGSESAKKTGLLDRVEKSLKEAGLEYYALGGVVANPFLSKVYEGIELGREKEIDFVLAVGGGSVLDSAKAIALGLANEKDDVWDYFSSSRRPQKTLPMGSIVTIAAAGSETSDSAVLTNDETHLKRGLNTELNRPLFAIMNPELTYTLPPFQTACGTVDIMMHTLERYFSPTENTMLVDNMAEGLLTTVIEAGRIAMEDSENYAARAELMWAGSISHNGLMSTGKISDFASHQLAHELSGKYNAAHGAALSAIWPWWARYVCVEKPEKFAQYAIRIWGLSNNKFEGSITGLKSAALFGIERTEAYFASLGMPINLPELVGKTLFEAEINEMTEKCTFYGKRTIGNYQVLDAEDIKAIYQMANTTNNKK